VAVASAVLAKWGETVMRRAGTNIKPSQPTTAIVQTGPFRFSRNPLYISLTLFYLGVCLMFNALWPLLLLPPLLVVVQRGIIYREERYLEAKFGEEYRDYRRRVRRWL
jgi:protein-S-isoprenylcysteine O-methyltransferase Ste14